MHGFRAHWRMAPLSESSVLLSKKLGLCRPIAQILANRGLHKIEEVELFLWGSWLDGPSPFLFKDMELCLERIERALAKKEKIFIFGDYDADGILALVMLYQTLSQLGAWVDYYVPDRLSEGYGIKGKHLELIKGKGASLVITVDCGIKANEFVRLAKEAKIDVIITDHHQPGGQTPEALAILNPHLPDSGYPFPHLTAVGVAFKLIQALLIRKKRESLLPHYLKLVAIGTITDMAPLIGENRLLVRHGLRTISEVRNHGLKKLLESCGLHGDRITEGDVSFRLGPRINAAGRMASADLAVKLLLSESEEEASHHSQKLTQLNNVRQQVEERILNQALTRIITRHWSTKYKIIIAGCEEWSRGIIGIVANRLKEQFCRPVILLAYENEYAYGSGRSIDSFSLIEALQSCYDLFEDFGGHHHAAGCVLRRERMAELKRRLNTFASSRLKDEDLKPTLVFDCPLRFAEINRSLLQSYQLLPPFGPGNPRPIFLFSGVKVKSKAKLHINNLVKLKMEQDSHVFEVMGTFSPQELACFNEGTRLDVVASLHFVGPGEEDNFIFSVEDWAKPR
ncbi:MAG: single-stranded-DNA-specific exonuclease RecJ [Candidatus Aminicenantes bacterium]|nr:single-stranded-DNA-specific exonuclease RecJ [Candidatus Aminicenantes bacterium]